MIACSVVAGIAGNTLSRSHGSVIASHDGLVAVFHIQGQLNARGEYRGSQLVSQSVSTCHIPGKSYPYKTFVLCVGYC